MDNTETKCHDKGKLDLLSIDEWLDSDFLLSMVEVLKQGAKKYEKDNWKKGTNWRKRLNSLRRHLLAFTNGEDIDAELGTDHLAMVAINAMMVWHWQKNNLGTDDRVKSEINLNKNNIFNKYYEQWRQEKCDFPSASPE